jgi:hypothetical protein
MDTLPSNDQCIAQLPTGPESADGITTAPTRRELLAFDEPSIRRESEARSVLQIALLAAREFGLGAVAAVAVIIVGGLLLAIVTWWLHLPPSP